MTKRATHKEELAFHTEAIRWIDNAPAKKTLRINGGRYNNRFVVAEFLANKKSLTLHDDAVTIHSHCIACGIKINADNKDRLCESC